MVVGAGGKVIWQGTVVLGPGRCGHLGAPAVNVAKKNGCADPSCENVCILVHSYVH